MKYINRVDIDFSNDGIFHPFYKTFRAQFVNDTKLPIYSNSYNERAPLITVTEAKRKNIAIDISKIYGFYHMQQGYVGLYLPKS